MSFLSRLFGSRAGGRAPKDVDAAIERLESEAQKAAPAYVGTAYNRVGDLALRSGQEDRALGFYGRSIDAFLGDAQREAARGVANKIIRVRPEAVRTLCTLTWLDLAARHQATALLHLRDYVSGARAAGQEARAATHIYEMARLSPDPEFVGAVADALDGLDFSNRAEEVRLWTATGSPGATEDAGDLADACMAAAMRSNDRGATLLTDEPGAEALRDAAASSPDTVPSPVSPVPAPSDGTPDAAPADEKTAVMAEEAEAARATADDDPAAASPVADATPSEVAPAVGKGQGKGRGKKSRNKRKKKR